VLVGPVGVVAVGLGLAGVVVGHRQGVRGLDGEQEAIGDALGIGPDGGLSHAKRALPGGTRERAQTMTHQWVMGLLGPSRCLRPYVRRGRDDVVIPEGLVGLDVAGIRHDDHVIRL